MDIDQKEMTREELLEFSLAESLLREARLGLVIAQQKVDVAEADVSRVKVAVAHNVAARRKAMADVNPGNGPAS